MTETKKFKSTNDSINKEFDYIVKLSLDFLNIIVLKSEASIEPVIQTTWENINLHESSEVGKCVIEFSNVNPSSEWPYYLLNMSYEEVKKMIDSMNKFQPEIYD